MVSKKKKKKSSPKLRVIFRPKSEIQRFFLPKIRWSQKKKRSSPISRLIFRPISQTQSFEGGLFSNGGAIFHFSQKIGLKSTKNMRFCILHKPMEGLEPPLATLLGIFMHFDPHMVTHCTTSHFSCYNCQVKILHVASSRNHHVSVLLLKPEIHVLIRTFLIN